LAVLIGFIYLVTGKQHVVNKLIFGNMCIKQEKCMYQLLQKMSINLTSFRMRLN